MSLKSFPTIANYFDIEIFVNEELGMLHPVDHDSVDRVIGRWISVLPDLDPVVQGAITRMQKLVKHLSRVRQASLARHDLQPFEFETLHTLAGLGPPHRAGPTELAAATKTAPATMTSRIDTLAERGFVRRLPSTTDRRKVVVELTDAGYRAWRGALDGIGDEETRLMGALSPDEQRQLADLLRSMLLLAEADAPTQPNGP
jgi:DNA-binding MarR family transcriptional regulator